MREARTSVRGPVDDFLVTCARSRADHASARRVVDICTAGLDWEAVIQGALRQGVFPLVHHAILAVCPDAVPPDKRELLQAHARSIATNNLLLASELVSAIDLLAANGIPSLPFKGPVLCQRIYGDLIHREFYDIDVLVRRADVGAAYGVLIANGYLQDDERPDIGTGPLPDDLHVELRHVGLGFMLELHWALSTREDPLPMEFDELWSLRQTVELLGRPMPAMHPADELFLLCAHGTRHGWNQLKWILDVADFVRASPSIDWDKLLFSTRSRGVERMLLVGLLLADNVAGLDLAPQIRDRCRHDASARALAAEASRCLFAPRQTESGGLIRLHVFRLRSRNRLRDKLRYIIRLLQPHETERILMPLPAHLRAIHFIARPLRIVSRLISRPSARRGTP